MNNYRLKHQLIYKNYILYTTLIITLNDFSLFVINLSETKNFKPLFKNLKESVINNNKYYNYYNKLIVIYENNILSLIFDNITINIPIFIGLKILDDINAYIHEYEEIIYNLNEID